MASVDERRAGFKRYKEDVAGRGKPFFPYAMFHDTVMSLVVVCVIIALAVIWKYTTTRRSGSRRALRREGRPRDGELRPAAGLVLLLPLLPAADLQVAGHGDPRDDRHPDDLPHAAARAAVRRHPAASGACSRRPVALVAAVLVVLSMGVLTYKGATAKESLGERGASRRCRRGRSRQGFAGNGARSRARSSSRSRLPAPATRTWAPAPRTTARPTCRRSARPARASQFFERYVLRPEQVRQHGHAAVRRQLTKQRSPDRRLPRRVQGRK